MSNQNEASGAILSADLAQSFSVAAGATFDALTGLRETIFEFVRAQQNGGASLESVIDRVHRAFNAAHRSVSESDGIVPGDPGDRRALIDRLTSWCAETYQS